MALFVISLFWIACVAHRYKVMKEGSLGDFYSDCCALYPT